MGRQSAAWARSLKKAASDKYATSVVVERLWAIKHRFSDVGPRESRSAAASCNRKNTASLSARAVVLRSKLVPELPVYSALTSEEVV